MATAASSRSASAPSTWRCGISRASIAGVPVHALLSDRPPAPIAACASTILATGDLERVGRGVRGLRRPGLPVRQGRLGSRPVHRLRARRRRATSLVARAVREAVGPDDRGDPGRGRARRWDAAHAIRMCRALDDAVRLYWLEDPLPEQDIDGLSRAPCGGRHPHLHRREGLARRPLRSLIESGALDVIMLDPGKAEGVTGTWDDHPHGGRRGPVLERSLLEQRAEHGRLAAPRPLPPATRCCSS